MNKNIILSLATLWLAVCFIVTNSSLAFAQEEKPTATPDSANSPQQVGVDRWNMGPSGGYGGFDWGKFNEPVPDQGKIIGVQVRAARYIDAIGLIYELPDSSKNYTLKGGSGGQLYEFPLYPDEYIMSFEGRFGAWIDRVVITTSKGRKSPEYGRGEGPVSFYYEAPPGTEIAGFFGAFGLYVDRVGVILRPSSVTNVSSASYKQFEVARDSLATAFGNGLANATEAATATPLPTSLAGTSVKIVDSLRKEHFAPLLAVSPRQVNYLIPPEVALGTAQVIISNAVGKTSLGSAWIVETRPGLFSANANGQGIAAAYLVRVKPDGTQRTEPISWFDSTLKKFIPVPIDVGSAADKLFLILHGTGIRRGKSVSAKIGNVDAEVTFADKQGQFAGLDQINLRIPLNVNWVGKGEVNLSLNVDGKLSNAVSAFFR